MREITKNFTGKAPPHPPKKKKKEKRKRESESPESVK
jgi:hypothetical protein